MNNYRNPIGKNRGLSLEVKLPAQHPVAAKRVKWSWTLLSVQGGIPNIRCSVLILLVSVAGSYAYFNQSTPIDNHQTDSGKIIDEGTLTNVIDSTFFNETQGIEIGEMI